MNKTPELVLEPLFMLMLCIYDAYTINCAVLKVALINL